MGEIIEPKFCKDCKHFVPKPSPGSIIPEYCINPDVLRGVEQSLGESTYLVTGEKPTVTEFSAFMARTIGVCGRDATYFEPRETDDGE